MNCVVLENKIQADGFFYLSLKPDKPLGEITPGEFVMIRCAQSLDPFLRRPMSIADFTRDGSRFGLLVQVTGKGTAILSRLETGGNVDVIGPFGKGFKVPAGAKSIWIVAGGCGVAPFLGLIDSSVNGPIDYTVFLGARSADTLLYTARFQNRGAQTIIATEDGSKGFHGLVTEPLREKLQDEKPDAIFTCGPNPMMRAVKTIAEKEGTLCFVSLENMMACGVGACLGCVAKVPGENRYVTTCKAGPVFDALSVEI
ncbi:Dihydroorotate dehydrogenase (NAD(+)), electron transfer subunit [hydrothermal vent metagenome]|uniref:Dihydroorotate dehydrogenase (NAD(+)), electron transfer subunit n=1 Tax=hydrothermal vent metagenome TaxID=652676 RepID=A0A3B1CI17_9ZZZZ